MGTTFSNVEIENNVNFVQDVMSDPFFKANAYLFGDDHNIYWAAVDPVEHPLYVWQKRLRTFWPTRASTYVPSAHGLGAVVFSNGPLMTIPGAKPYGPVFSAANRINDPGAGNLDQWLYALGRKTPAGAVKFSDYNIFPAQTAGVDATTAGYAEVIIGLYPLIINGVPCSKNPTDSNYNKAFDNFIKTATIVAWGLIPPADEGTKGLLVAAGHESSVFPSSANDIERVYDDFIIIGVKDAVATDGGTHVASSSSMIGEHRTSWFDPAENVFVEKQTLQKYGFYCK
jgi:hypothetical protein